WFDEETKRYNISRPIDSNKDQTYALWGLKQEALSKTIFPIGELTKPEVRQLATKYGLKTANKDESFEICFVADNNYRRFIKERVPDIDSQVDGGSIMFDGKEVGKHRGFPYYTIGQRSGLGAFGERVFVTDIDAQSNTITIGRKDDLLRSELIAKDVNFISIEDLTEPKRVEASVRYKDTVTPATILPETDGKIRVVFHEPKRAITPGQSVVLYDGERLLGGGVIERVIK
ncbi:MAG: tRNA 2-thiouridine(34) synthase MnmA, partial [Ignavibacteriae bacterium]|nr:tRNA 2-thiouridine(34) synthase MnmA [Ignavibacteriota bacterium]